MVDIEKSTHVRSVSWKLFQIFWWNFTSHVKHNEQGTEHKNRNSDLTLFGIMALWTWKIVFSVIYLCPLCNLKTVWDIFLKLYANVYHHDGLGGSVWCAVPLETRRSRVQPSPRSATFFHGDYFLRSFSPFRWFKKGSCQFLAKECAQYWLTT